MSYVPKNPSIFTAAFSGAMAGIGAGRVNTSTDINSYLSPALIAGAFAQELDAIWGNVASTSLDIQLISQASEGLFENRDPLLNSVNIDPATYIDVAGAIVAAVNAARAYFTSNAIIAAGQIPIIPGIEKDFVNTVALPLFKIDINDLPTDDNSWGAKLFFGSETTNGTDIQIREGDANVAIAYKAGAFTTAQALNATGALTAGTFTVALSWTTLGTVATLNATMTSNLVGPLTSAKFRYQVMFAAHNVIQYL